MSINIKISMFIAAAALTASLLSCTYPQQAVFAETTNVSSESCKPNFLGFPAWYSGLTKDGSCEIKNPSTVTGGLSGFIWTVVINVVSIILMLTGYISVGYIIYGGFLMLTTRGIPGEIAEGQLTVRNAIIGLVISFGSVAMVNFISGIIK